LNGARSLFAFRYPSIFNFFQHFDNLPISATNNTTIIMKSFGILLTIVTGVSALPQLTPHLHRRQSQIIPVVVGGPQDTFVPNALMAAVGDIIQFQFSNGNHTVTQSTSDKACTPMDAGVHSGHIPFKDGQTDVGTFNMPVTSTDPMFLYCATGPHCQEGQVMIINP
jgi:plastocyanin